MRPRKSQAAARGSVSRSPLPGVTGATRESQAWVGERAGRAGAAAAGRPLPRRHESGAGRCPQPTRVPPLATNQSEAGWAGSRERLLLQRGWLHGAARTVSRRFSLTVSLPRREEPRPAAGPRACPPVSEKIKWSLGGGTRRSPGSCLPMLAHSRLFHGDKERASGAQLQVAWSQSERCTPWGAGDGRTGARALTSRSLAGGWEAR